MPRIDLTTSIDCDPEESSRFVVEYEGEIFDFEDDEDDDDNFPEQTVKIGKVKAYLLLRDRACNQHKHCFDIMDEVSHSTCECYEALLDLRTDDWKKKVTALYNDELIFRSNLLLIASLELEPKFRGRGIGRQVAQELIAALGSGCGIVACKPFPLQYEGWSESEERHAPGFEKKRLADFKRVAKFWSDLGFRKVPRSEFYILAPEFQEVPVPTD